MPDKLTDTLIMGGERVATSDMKRFWKERPDPGFSVARNEAVIARSIKNAERLRKQKIKEKQDGLGERVGALTSYMQHLKQGKDTSVENYFGRKELTRLQGKKVIQILKERKDNGQKLWEIKSLDNRPGGYK